MMPNRKFIRLSMATVGIAAVVSSCYLWGHRLEIYFYDREFSRIEIGDASSRVIERFGAPHENIELGGERAKFFGASDRLFVYRVYPYRLGRNHFHRTTWSIGLAPSGNVVYMRRSDSPGC